MVDSKQTRRVTQSRKSSSSRRQQDTHLGQNNFNQVPSALSDSVVSRTEESSQSTFCSGPSSSSHPVGTSAPSLRAPRRTRRSSAATSQLAQPAEEAVLPTSPQATKSEGAARASTSSVDVSPQQQLRRSCRSSNKRSVSSTASASPEDTRDRKRQRSGSVSPYNLRARKPSAAAAQKVSASPPSAKRTKSTMSGRKTAASTSQASASSSKGRRRKANSNSSRMSAPTHSGCSSSDPMDEGDMRSFITDEVMSAEHDDGIDASSEGHAGENAAGQGGVNVDDSLDEDDEDDMQQGAYDDDDMDDPYGEDFGGSGFAANLRAMAGYLSGNQSRFRNLLTSLQTRKDPAAQLIALQELSEALSLANEDTLSGFFPTESFVRELVYIMGGPKPPAAGAVAEVPVDEDMAAAEAIAAADFGDNGETVLLACRCLANLIEAMPYAAHAIVSYGSVPVLLSKLHEIEFIDLAEQTLQTLEKISVEFPSAIVREGGLTAMLQYLDFFNIHIQRTAMTAVSHCCRRLSPEHISKVRDVIPIIRNVLSYADQRLVESACKCIVRIIESFKYQAEHLEQLIDKDVIQALNALLLHGSPSSSGVSVSTSVGTSTYTDILKSLGIAVRASPKAAVDVLETNIVETLYQLLRGGPPPSAPDSSTSALVAPATQLEASRPSNADEAVVAVVGDADSSVAVADMAVLQNLAHRPKEQVQEALSLIGELLPPLPRDGVFDPRAYTEKAWHKKRRADRASREKARSKAAQAEETNASIVIGGEGQGEGEATPISASRVERAKSEKELAREQAQSKRIELLQAKPELVKRFADLVLPTLVEVYAASVALQLRTKTMNGMLKIISFVEAAPLNSVLDNVPMASFVASILSSRDDPSLVLSALQMVELLCQKLPSVYKSLLRREGVMWEIDDIASQEPSTSRSKTLQQTQLTLPGSAATNGNDSTAADSRTTAAPTSTERSITNDPLLSSTLGLVRPVTSASLSGSTPAMDPHDVNIWRARVLRDVFAREAANSEGGADHAIRSLESVKALVSSLHSVKELSEAQTALDEIMALFAKPDEPISSFELLRSGLVEGLYAFASGSSTELTSADRRKALINAMTTPGSSGVARSSALVKRLQESLSRLETMEIAMALNSPMDDTRKGSSVHRQLRLRLQAEDSTDVPKSCNNMVVGIHAIASFERLAEFLRPKMSAASALSALAGAEGGSSRLSSVLAALSGSPSALENALAASSRLRDANPTAGASASGAKSQSSSPIKPRRRSSRLIGKSPDAAADPAVPSSNTDSAGASAGNSAAAQEEEQDLSEEAAREMLKTLLPGDDEDDDAGFDDEEDEMGQEIFEDELGPVPAGDDVADRTFNLSVAEDGNKIDVKTPDGTRIPTPIPAVSGSAGPAARKPSLGASGARPSYAAALQRKPSDWHIQFSMDGRSPPLDSTIYAAIHQHETNATSAAKLNGPSASQYIWSNVYTIKFKKVIGPVPPIELGQTPEPEAFSGAAADLPSSIPADSPFAKILQLLRVLHELNAEWRETYAISLEARANSAPLAETAFVNNKLTAKLNRQLEEPMIVASRCMPDWSLHLPRKFPFLFPFEARYAFLQSTSFGYNRMLQRWHHQLTRTQEGTTTSSLRHDDQSLAHLVRLPRAKVRIARDNLLPSAFRVMELYGKTDTILEVEYFEEVGTGLGPTLEFYALASREFARKDLRMWRDQSPADSTSRFVYAPNGLFPAPISDSESTSIKGIRTGAFKILGQFVAKAILDSRIIDCNFSPLFMRSILNQRVGLTLEALAAVDGALAASLRKLSALKADELSGLGLEFTLPGNDSFELRANGKSTEVNKDNLDDYISDIIDVSIGRGIQPLVRAFRSGFNQVFPVSAMTSFTADELVMLFGNTEEDWSEATLNATIKPDHGYNSESPSFRSLISLMGSFDLTERREFLQWLTGSPKLPIGGFGGLQPQLTVVKRPHEPPLQPDDYLASNMSCANFLKLPSYSTIDVMRKRLATAVTEGAGSFNLS